MDNLEEQVGLYMRVSNVFHDVKLAVKADDQIIKEVKKRHMAPGEMESIKVDVEAIRNINPKRISIEVM